MMSPEVARARPSQTAQDNRRDRSNFIQIDSSRSQTSQSLSSGESNLHHLTLHGGTDPKVKESIKESHDFKNASTASSKCTTNVR